MASYITIDTLKSALIEMKNNIVSKFYNKIEVDNKLTQIEDDIHTLVIDELDTATTVTIPNQVDTLTTGKFAEYDASLDTKVQDILVTKNIDPAKLITVDDLTVSKVITTDNLVANNIATIHDLPTALDSTTFDSMVTDLTTDGGVY